MSARRHATLVINPAAGSARRLAAQLPTMMARLNAAGYDADCRYTSAAADSAEAIARDAAGKSELMLACGGDGTVHGVVQGMAHSAATLGVVPLGTANALARNLGLPLEPVAALERLLTYRARRIPLGRAETAGGSCFFVVMAGCGPDGALVHSLLPAEKLRFGRRAYYAHAARLFLTRRWPAFAVSYRTCDGAERTMRGVAVMVSRVPDLGGAFAGLTAGAGLLNGHLRLQVLRPPAVASLPAWFALSRAGLPNPWLVTVEVEAVRCVPLGTGAVLAQADAEPLGGIPLQLGIVPDALRLLMPD